MREYAAIGAFDQTRGPGDHAAGVIARAPAWARAAINRERARRGLPVVLGLEESRSLEAELARVRVAAAGRAIAPDPRSPIARQSGRPLQGGSRPAAAAPELLRVLLAGGVGIARSKADGSCVGEITANDAFGPAARINQSRMWSLLAGGHSGEPLEWAGQRLRALDCDDLPLLLEWRPRMGLRSHREAVARIEAGQRGVSLRYHVVGSPRIQNLPMPTRVLERCGLIHAALLGPDELPKYPGATAAVFRGPDDPGELRRQIAAIVAQARRLSAEADYRAARRRYG